MLSYNLDIEKETLMPQIPTLLQIMALILVLASIPAVGLILIIWGMIVYKGLQKRYVRVNAPYKIEVTKEL